MITKLKLTSGKVTYLQKPTCAFQPVWTNASFRNCAFFACNTEPARRTETNTAGEVTSSATFSTVFLLKTNCFNNFYNNYGYT